MAIAYPREFGKTTYGWELLSTWNALHRRYKNIVYIASTVKTASRMFSTNVVPNLVSHPLVKENIVVKRNTREEFHFEAGGQKIFMSCFGAGQNLRGLRMSENRPDLIIIDDIESTEHTRSADQREKLLDWWAADVLPLGKEARFFFIGTMIHADSLLAKLLENPPLDLRTGKKWETRRYGVLDSEGKSVWPEKYSDDWIAAKRLEYIKMGALDRYNTEYLNMPITKSDRLFQPTQLNYYAPDQLKAVLSGGADILITVDPGIHNDSHRDPTVILASAMDKNGNIWVLELLRERYVHHEILENIVATYRRWNPRMTYIESVQAQFWLLQDLQNGTHVTRDIIPCEKIDGSQVRMGKEVRIQGLEDTFHRKKIYIPAEAQWIDYLIDEMVTFPKGRHDDILDTISYAKLNHIQIGGCNYDFTGMLEGSTQSSTVF